MKEKATYKRFDLLSALAVLGCIGMMVFEAVFVFELYNRAVAQPEAPAQAAPSVQTPVEPVTPSAPVEVPPVQSEAVQTPESTVPAPSPVG